MEQKNLKDMSLTEKKAMVYDLIAQRDNINQSIQVVNQAIFEDMSKTKKE